MTRDTSREPWWTWHWDRTVVENSALLYTNVTRWRRGSLLTVYRMRTVSGVQWWIYLPFNFCIGFGREA